MGMGSHPETAQSGDHYCPWNCLGTAVAEPRCLGTEDGAWEEAGATTWRAGSQPKVVRFPGNRPGTAQEPQLCRGTTWEPRLLALELVGAKLALHPG